jgi:hypothetical protein
MQTLHKQKDEHLITRYKVNGDNNATDKFVDFFFTQCR